MGPLRVGFFTECYHPIVNGVVASVDALAAQLRLRDHEVFCFAPQVPGYLESDGPVFRMPSLPLPTSTDYRLTLPIVSRRNRRDVIQTLDLIHTHSPFITGWMGVRFARRYGVPVVFTYHTQLEHYAHYVPFDRDATRRIATTLTRAYANAVDAVIVPTASMEARLRGFGVTTPIAVIPSGIDVAAFAAGRRDESVRARLGALPGDVLVLSVGRLGREKNLGLALEALARLPLDVRLAVVGDGPEREALVGRAAALGITGRVRFLGALEKATLPDVYASADAFVFPSASETQGLVLAEALAAGLAVVALDTPQGREVLGDAAAFVRDDPGALAAALAGAVAGASPLRARTLRRSAERFAAGAQSELVLGLYARVLGRPLPAAAPAQTPA